MKNRAIRQLPKAKLGSRISAESWHNGGDIEICSYARSLQNAAKTLVGNSQRSQETKTDWDCRPIVLLYRQSLELHLKLLVGEGSNFLRSPTDPISLSTTHSLRWLAQIVCRIIKAVRWEKEFVCEGISSLADFTSTVNEVESFDPVSRAIRSARSAETASENYRDFDLPAFARKLDALLDLLDSTTDALAATWDQRVKVVSADPDDFGPTIH
jgi:hypothetical protein